MKPTVLYEVYDNRAVLQPIDGLVLLDRRTRFDEARKAAIMWAGCVVKVKCVILTRRPLTRRVISTEVVYIFRTKLTGDDPTGGLTIKLLRGKLRTFDGKLNRYKRRKW